MSARGAARALGALGLSALLASQALHGASAALAQSALHAQSTPQVGNAAERAAPVDAAWLERIAAQLDELARVREGSARAPLLAGLCAPLEAAGAAAWLALAQLDEPRAAALADALAECAGPSAVPQALALLEPEAAPLAPSVALALARYLARLDLDEAPAASSASARAAALERLVHAPDANVRAAALGGLVRLAPQSGHAPLEDLLAAFDSQAELELVRKCLELPQARGALIELVAKALDASAQPARLGADALAELLPSWAEALASRPEWLAGLQPGSPSRELTPEAARALSALARAPRHADARVARAGEAALDRLGGRLLALGLEGECARLYEALAARGLDPVELALRRARLALLRGNQPAAALEPARYAQRQSSGARDARELQRALDAHALEGAAHIASGAPRAALEPLQRAADAAAALVARRPELVPDPDWPRDGPATEAERAHEARGAIELLRASAWSKIAAAAQPEGADPQAEVERARRALREHLHAAHCASMQAQIVRAGQPDASGFDGLDGMLGHANAPRALLCSNPDQPAEQRRAWIEHEQALLAALAELAPDELPGFAPAPGAPRSGPLGDPPRRALLERVRSARLAGIARAIELRMRGDAPDMREVFLLRMMADELERQASGEPEQAERGLLDQRVPSMAALELVEDLRAEDRPAEAHALCARALADLQGNGFAERSTWGGWFAARLETALGGTLSDLRRPQEAQVEYERALRRLESIENTLLARERDAALDAREQRALERDLAATRARQCAVLIGLAVNANVRMHELERALAYFERAYALDQSDFMKVLLACYRARSGRQAEARAVLAAVEVAPALYYNLACTHALLGDAQRALDYLARELFDNHASESARERQRKWAREDPDLASLRGDERFEALVADP